MEKVSWKKRAKNRLDSYRWCKSFKEKIYFEIGYRPWISNLEKEISKIKPDVILVHNTTSFSTLRVAFFCKKKKIPCMFDNHMIFCILSKSLVSKLFYFIIKNFVSKYISKIAYKVIGVTDETCKYLNCIEGYSKNKIFYLPLGIDHSVFHPIKRNKKNRKIKNLKIIQTGKLNDDKKPNWTASAVLELLKKGENISLEFIGAGSKEIKSKIEESYIRNKFFKNIKFTNFQNQNQLIKSYNDCDLCIFPDGTSLSALQVAACKKPVIMADYQASRTRSKLGIGLTYKTGDIKDLQDKIMKLRRNNKFYKKISSTGYEVVKKKFTYEKISKTFINLCKKAIENKKKNP